MAYILWAIPWMAPFALVIFARSHGWMSKTGAVLTSGMVLALSMYLWWWMSTTEADLFSVGFLLGVFYAGPLVLSLGVLLLAAIDRSVRRIAQVLRLGPSSCVSSSSDRASTQSVPVPQWINTSVEWWSSEEGWGPS